MTKTDFGARSEVVAVRLSDHKVQDLSELAFERSLERFGDARWRSSLKIQ